MSSTDKKNKYQKSNAKHWCEFCRVYVYDNVINRTRHENSPQHKAALTRRIQRLEKEEKEQSKMLKKLALPSSATSTIGGKSNSSYYDNQAATSASTSRASVEKPIDNVLTIGKRPQIGRVEKAGKNDGDNKLTVLGGLPQTTKREASPDLSQPEDNQSAKTNKTYLEIQPEINQVDKPNILEESTFTPIVKFELRKVTKPVNLRKK